MGQFYLGIGLLWVLLAVAGFVFLGPRIVRLLSLIKDPVVLAFSTASSEAAYPKTLEQLERFGASKKITSFVLPLGYSFNLDGSMDEVKTMAAHGITYAAPQVDLAKLRTFKDGVVKKLTGGLAGMAKTRKVQIVRGVGRFLDPNHLEVQMTTGAGRDTTSEKKTIRFQKAIIAAGSEAARLPFMPVPRAM